MKTIFEKTDRMKFSDIGVGDEIIVGYKNYDGDTRLHLFSPKDSKAVQREYGIGIGTVLSIKKTPKGYGQQGKYITITVGGVPGTHVMAHWTVASVVRYGG
jgi:hypothetical protein